MSRCQFLFFSLLIWAISLADLTAADKVRFGNSTRTNAFEILPLLAASEKDFWKGQGLEAEWIMFDSGAAHMQAVAAAAIDAGITVATEVIVSVSRGIPMALVADLQIDYEMFVWVRPESPFQGPKDLKGATLGVARLGSMGHTFGRVAAKGVGIEKDIKFLATGGITPMLAALKARSVQGIIASDLTMAVPKFKGEARALLNVGDYLPKPWMGIGIFAREDFMKKKPEATRRMVKAVLKGADFARENREWAIEKMKEIFGYPEEVGREVYKSLRYGRDGRINIRGLESVMNFMTEWGLIEKGPPLEKLYSASFVE